ncbi:MAG TPA: RDD family protein [Thermoleophilaceae bacterium]|jgi:uncharacterized RDD family membrane protein YckC
MSYAGIVTRGVALVIDSALVNLLAIVIGGAVNLVASLFGNNLNFDLGGAVVAAVLWFLWVGFYFTTFWAVTGQTPGDRILGIQVVSADGGGVGALQAIRRYLGLALCLLSLGLGFVPVLFDSRRRGLHDMLGGTVVRWVAAPAQRVPAALLTPGEATAPGAPPPPGL